MDVSAVVAVARGRIEAQRDAVAGVSAGIDESFVRAASVISRSKGKLFIGGSGTSGAVAHRMAHILSVTGTPSVYFSPVDTLHGGAGMVTEEDVVLLISKGGASDEVLRCEALMRQRGAITIGLSRAHTTKLAQAVDLSVAVDVPDSAELGGVVATGITLAQSVWGDALAEVLMRGRGFTLKEFHQMHPAGAVGQLKKLPPEMAPIELPDLGLLTGGERDA